MVKNKEPEKTKEKSMEQNLSDPVYVNYNLLLKLEEIKKIVFGIYEIQKYYLERMLRESEKPEEVKEEKEGTFKNS